MKNRYTLTVLLCTFYLTSISQQNNYPMETVGSPTTSTTVSSYTGWANNGLLSFAGTSEVQNVNSSNNLSASGAGNVFFNNVVGTNLEISGFSPTTAPQSLDITFSMFGYNPSNLNELVLEYTTDGINYTPLPYKRLFRNYLPATPWDVMVSDPVPGNLNFSNLKIRFRQTSNVQTFRIDDIAASFYFTLPIKLISFSAANIKGENKLDWRASSTDEHEYFVIEKSNNGRYFTPVANVQVKGIGEYSYQYTDNTAGKTFYRLKLVDVSGRTTYSPIVFVNEKATGTELIQKIYPVPATQVLNTQLLSSKQENVMVSLSDISGRMVTSRSFSLTQGMNNCAINVEKMNAGMYILKIITADNIIETRTVIIQ
jgi:hypothetical protein